MEQILDNDFEQIRFKHAEYAGFFERFLAVLIDGLILGIIQYIVGFATGAGMANTFSILNDRASITTAAIASVSINTLIGLAYFVILESGEKQATLGKQALGLIVTDTNGERISSGKAFVRHLSKWLSALFLLIGYLMQPFTEKRQALHDIIAGTLIYKK